uniref:Uncharacterized protein n=1 Tax=Rhizophora mucronata TaxID=61149 RepID=A0A2P2PCZ9_RHIMU
MSFTKAISFPSKGWSKYSHVKRGKTKFR